jgi:hypothetical protein
MNCADRGFPLPDPYEAGVWARAVIETADIIEIRSRYLRFSIVKKYSPEVPFMVTF